MLLFAVVAQILNISVSTYLGLWSIRHPHVRKIISLVVVVIIAGTLDRLVGCSSFVSASVSFASIWFGCKLSVVGLTGGIGTGKSTVSKILQKNFPIIDGDLIAREIVVPGQPALNELVARFGEDILQEDGTLNRPKLGSIVFGNKEERKALDKIMLPKILRTSFFRLLRHRILEGHPVVIIDNPLLFETKFWLYFCSTVVVVSCPPEKQLSRLMKRNSLSETDALNRINAQMPLEEKVAGADVVLDNSGEVEALYAQTEELCYQLIYSGGAVTGRGGEKKVV